MNIGDMLGFGPGGRGGDWNASGVPIEQAVGTDQTGDSYHSVLDSLAQQQAFLNALQSQGGIGNQQNVFNQQQALANQLQGVANGTGPNPALAQLANTTGQNVNQQASLMGSQRGANANAGLAARNIGMQGAGIQQQAAGQAAVLGAQQQLQGMGQLQNQQGMMGSLANQQVNQQGNALNTLNQGQQSEQSNLLNALGQFNNARVGLQSNINSANAGINTATAQGQQGLLGGVLGAAGAALMLNKGGEVPGYCSGGNVQKFWSGGVTQPGGPQSFAGNYFSGNTSNAGAVELNKGASMFGKMAGQQIKNYLTPNSLDAGQQDTVREGLNSLQGFNPSMGANAPGQNFSGDYYDGLYRGGMAKTFKEGGNVPGKPKVMGDSMKNDTVNAKLSPGEIVIPNHITESPNAPALAAQFVAAVLNRKRVA